jgi:uncharacterized Tic20 family protein
MVVYAENVFNHKLGYSDITNLSLNIAMLSVFYAFLGGVVSFAFHYLFDEFDDEWKKKSLAFKVYDISIEIALLALIAFWSVFIINTHAPIFPVRHYLAGFVDTYTSGMFFIYAIFLFLDALGDKLRFLYETYLQEPFKTTFPTIGSILDLSLRYEK